MKLSLNEQGCRYYEAKEFKMFLSQYNFFSKKLTSNVTEVLNYKTPLSVGNIIMEFGQYYGSSWLKK